MASTFAGGTLRVTTPSSYDAQPASRITDARPADGGAGDGPAVAGKDALVAALEDAGLDQVERVDLTPQRHQGHRREAGAPTSAGQRAAGGRRTSRRGRRRAARARRRLLLAPAGEPRRAHQVPRRRSPAPRGSRSPCSRGGPPAAASPRRRPGRPARPGVILGDLVQGAAQALVFRFVAPAILEKAIEKMEEHVRPGLLHLAGTDVKQWRELETLDELHLPTDKPVRLLLFVHGTFSSTVGGFGALGIDEKGEGVPAHRHLGVRRSHRVRPQDPQPRPTRERRGPADPPQDAPPRGRARHRHHHAQPGRAVTRSLVEQLLPAAGWPATVDNIVFVAATNAGTHLADPKRWSDLVDLYTNLAAVGASGLAALPGAAPVAAVVGGVVKGIGAFVKYLVSYAAEGDDVPGLKAMMTGGAFVEEINKTQQGQPGPGRAGTSSRRTST